VTMRARDGERWQPRQHPRLRGAESLPFHPLRAVTLLKTAWSCSLAKL
jgi:hypothetical protein